MVADVPANRDTGRIAAAAGTVRLSSSDLRSLERVVAGRRPDAHAAPHTPSRRAAHHVPLTARAPRSIAVNRRLARSANRVAAFGRPIDLHQRRVDLDGPGQ